MDEFAKWQSKVLRLKESVKSQLNEDWLKDLISADEDCLKSYKARVAMKIINDEIRNLKNISSELFDIVQLIDSKMSLISLLIHHNVDKGDINEISAPLKNFSLKQLAVLADQLNSQTALVGRLMEMKFSEYGHFFCELEKHKGT